jgi:hypothetical protein
VTSSLCAICRSASPMAGIRVALGLIAVAAPLGSTAEEHDLRAASARDNKLLVALILAVVLVIPIVLLRLVAPALRTVGKVRSNRTVLGRSRLASQTTCSTP